MGVAMVTPEGTPMDVVGLDEARHPNPCPPSLALLAVFITLRELMQPAMQPPASATSVGLGIAKAGNRQAGTTSRYKDTGNEC